MVLCTVLASYKIYNQPKSDIYILFWLIIIPIFVQNTRYVCTCW